jgi:hypothetical protein
MLQCIKNAMETPCTQRRTVFDNSSSRAGGECEWAKLQQTRGGHCNNRKVWLLAKSAPL